MELVVLSTTSNCQIWKLQVLKTTNSGKKCTYFYKHQLKKSIVGSILQNGNISYCMVGYCCDVQVFGTLLK